MYNLKLIKKILFLSKSIIIESTISEKNENNILLYSWAIFFVILILLYIKDEKLIRIWSIINLIILGLLGLILIFMCWGTDHRPLSSILIYFGAVHFILFLIYIIINKS